MRGTIEHLVKQFLVSLKIKGTDVNFTVEYPKIDRFGDYSSNVAMLLSKILKKPPMEIAESAKIFFEDSDLFEKVDTVNPGFINFFVKDTVFFEHIEKIAQMRENYFKPSLAKPKKIQVEFVSANPTGPLHIGHGRGAAIGDCIARILSFCGHTVEREYYINDAGFQMKMLGISTFIRYKQLLGIDESFPENGYQGEYITHIAEDMITEYGDMLLKKPEDETIGICTKKAGDVIMSGILESLGKFRVSFDKFFKEKQLFDSKFVQDTIELLSNERYIYKKDGAVWFKTTAFGDDKDRVIRKSDGAYTYFASDVAYHRDKFLRRQFDDVIDVWGADHHGYVNRMKSAVRALGIDEDKLHIVLVQIVNLLRLGKKVSMSTRRAEYVELDDVLNEVGVDAARFMLVSRSVDSHIDFDLDLVKRQSNDNPVFYAQYAYARIMNIFKNIKEQGINIDNEFKIDKLKEKKEVNLAKSIIKFKDSINAAHNDLEPYHIVKGILDISEKLHQFYNKHRVIGSEPSILSARVFLLKAVQITLRLGFDLIGVEAKNKM